MAVKSRIFIGIILWLVSANVIDCETAYGCYGPPGSPCTQHTLSCAEGQVLAFYKISYGKKRDQASCSAVQDDQCSSSACCQYENSIKDMEPFVDASLEDRKMVNGKCANQQSCVFSSPYTPGNLTNYNYVHYWYACIPTLRNFNLLNISQMTTSKEFLLYFNGISRRDRGLKCTCDITSNDLIRIASLYINLSPESCSKIKISSLNQTLFNCSNDGVVVFFQYLDVTGQQIKLEIDVSSVNVEDVLWMYFHSNLGDIDVSCTNCEGRIQQNDSALTYRLVGGRSQLEGRVEVLYNNTWGTICDDYWGPEEEMVVCRHLGYNPTGIKEFYGPGAGPIWLDDVLCTGLEASLADCKHSGWQRHNCDHREDISVVCKDVEYRLVEGSGSHEGRVEVFFNNQWGTVCDHGWGESQARVVCKQLGFETTQAKAFPLAHFGEGFGPIWLDEVMCTGSESSLATCRHRGWGVNNCSHSEDASVVCKRVSYRLVAGGVPYAGRVEVFHNNQWGTICDDGWGEEESAVVCSQLGFNPGVSKAYFGPGSGPIWLDDVACSGTETSITDCKHTDWSVHNCDHREDVSVACKPVTYRLVNGTGRHEGRVEVFFNNAWGTICGYGWGDEDAAVVCKERGFSSAGAEARTGAYFGEGVGSIWLTEVACAGIEPTVGECSHPDWAVHNCTHDNDASVICKYGPGELLISSETEIMQVEGQLLINMKEDDNISLTCATECVPECLIDWYKTTVDNIYSDPLPSINGKLTLTDINKNQSGSYYCVAVNPDVLGITQTKAIIINVIYGPNDIQLTLLSDILAMEGEIKRLNIVAGQNISVTCYTDCYPTCLINWYKSTTVRDPLPTLKGQLSLTKANRNQSGFYYCSAINPVIRNQVKTKSVDVEVINRSFN
ncbi:deleted in malignant brain tumors 1 protein [Patella vulgata]|uniref:deleted in malignant brain tumors 1 protein n=1 Tax=Patella vulgata TaxID=6465 RepID=UPI0024A7C10D|nr:deleted in malignant brain tumors 1 protein [Patella vulgata]